MTVGSRARTSARAAARRSLLAPSTSTKEFGGLVAVNDVSLEIPTHAIVSIIGPNGAGKTTFFNMLTGPVQADARPDPASATATSPRARPDVITALGVARTFQNIRLFGAMTRARERDGRPARADERRACSARSSGRRGCAARSARCASAAREMLALRRTAAERQFDQLARQLSATATSAASRSRARSPPSRSCCCSTSRPPG